MAYSLQDIKSGGIPNIAANVSKIKVEAERLEVVDKAPGILAELLYTENFLAEVKEYRPIIIHVSVVVCGCKVPHLGSKGLLSEYPSGMKYYWRFYGIFIYLFIYLFYLVCCGKPESPEVPADWF
jgi:hypothetical protein